MDECMTLIWSLKITELHLDDISICTSDYVAITKMVCDTNLESCFAKIMQRKRFWNAPILFNLFNPAMVTIDSSPLDYS